MKRNAFAVTSLGRGTAGGQSDRGASTGRNLAPTNKRGGLWNRLFARLLALIASALGKRNARKSQDCAAVHRASPAPPGGSAWAACLSCGLCAQLAWASRYCGTAVSKLWAAGRGRAGEDGCSSPARVLPKRQFGRPLVPRPAAARSGLTVHFLYVLSARENDGRAKASPISTNGSRAAHAPSISIFGT